MYTMANADEQAALNSLLTQVMNLMKAGRESTIPAGGAIALSPDGAPAHREQLAVLVPTGQSKELSVSSSRMTR